MPLYTHQHTLMARGELTVAPAGMHVISITQCNRHRGVSLWQCQHFRHKDMPFVTCRAVSKAARVR